MQYKTVLIGDVCVGKTSIAQRIVFNRFTDARESTIGAAFSRYVDHDNNIVFNLWDTAGQERFKSLVPMYLRDAKIILLVYDATNRQTYDSLLYWFDKVKESNIFPLCIVMIRNKIDAQPEPLLWDQGKATANANNWIYIETSAKYDRCILPTYTGQVEDVLKYIATQIINTKQHHNNNNSDNNKILTYNDNDENDSYNLCSC